MFTAHVSGWQHSELMEMEPEELHFWYNEAVKLHNKLNRSSDG